MQQYTTPDYGFVFHSRLFYCFNFSFRILGQNSSRKQFEFFSFLFFLGGFFQIMSRLGVYHSTFEAKGALG